MERQNDSILENQNIDRYAVSIGQSLASLKTRKEKIRAEVNVAKYLDPRFDPGFKKLLGTKDALKCFLNEVLAPMKIESVEQLRFENTEMNIYTPEHLQLRMDIGAKYPNDTEVKKGGALPVSEKIKYILIDLGKFSKSFEELENDEDRWLYLLKNAGTAKNELPKFNDAALDDAIMRIRVDVTDDETKNVQIRELKALLEQRK
ncbi:MAG: Rpn family recombination-promoting nuclease/putative transposase [Fibrobacter sp.]|nr:Rpn family recombination-promoting nuclease/putative transposase [Fibrobacter sp.]